MCCSSAVVLLQIVWYRGATKLAIGGKVKGAKGGGVATRTRSKKAD